MKTPIDQAIDSQAEAWLVKLIARKLAAGPDHAYAEAVDSEVEAESMRDFGYSRGTCTPRDPVRFKRPG